MDKVVADLEDILRQEPWNVKEGLQSYVHKLKSVNYVTGTQRTPQQNKALHKYFDNLAIALNEGGYSVQLALKERIELEWDSGKVKELMWRPMQMAILGKESTKELSKIEDIDRVYEHLNRHTSEKFHISVDFPSHELGYWEKAPLKKDV